MSGDQALRVVLCWHMHQPYYIDPESKEYQLPWTYLHAIKDYVDMAWYLENTPQAMAVINFTPTLLEQLDDYSRSIRACLRFGPKKPWCKFSKLKDPVLKALAYKTIPKGKFRLNLIKACLKANQDRLIDRYPVYKKLSDMGRWLQSAPEYCDYIDEQYFFDLVSWYHIAWLGETIKRESQFLKRVIDEEVPFSYRRRLKLLKLIGRLIHQVIPRYKSLWKKGKVELSVTPYAHPIAPLLLDLNSAREAMPDVELPQHNLYPAGAERFQWHIEKGIEVFKKYFGFIPKGCWPAEGSVSDESMVMIRNMGFDWVATGENVLKNSIANQQNSHLSQEYCVHRRYELQKGLSCFFRDDGLSDEIGFNYSDWHADDAVANLIHHLENIRSAQNDISNAVVSIILDGENAWEHYPDNGFYFLSALYAKLSEHKLLKMSTFSECISSQISSLKLKSLVSGSWVYGTFSTWIGHPEKNKAWELLFKAKYCVDETLKTQSFSATKKQAIEKQLAICEGSDWFWWFGDDNPSEAVKDFDLLYRQQLKHLYFLLGVALPDELDNAISIGGEKNVAVGGVMKPGNIERLNSNGTR